MLGQRKGQLSVGNGYSFAVAVLPRAVRVLSSRTTACGKASWTIESKETRERHTHAGPRTAGGEQMPPSGGIFGGGQDVRGALGLITMQPAQRISYPSSLAGVAE